MFCKSCGKEIADTETFCPHCGAPANQQSSVQQSYAPPAPAEKNTMALAGLICAFLVPLVGFILSIIGLKKSKTLGGEGKGLAIGGIVVSCIELFVYVIVIALYATVILAALGAAGAL